MQFYLFVLKFHIDPFYIGINDDVKCKSIRSRSHQLMCINTILEIRSPELVLKGHFLLMIFVSVTKNKNRYQAGADHSSLK